MSEQSPNSDVSTHGIRIEAAARHLEDDSDPDRGRYYYIYRIRITNDGTERAKLLSRHWVILDANNQREEVVGKGVVGKQPDLGPGEAFEYTSFCPLRTEWGTMEGSYTFVRPDGSTFHAAVGRFFLAPSAQNAIVEQ